MSADPYALVEGVDYYWDAGRVVFTAHFLQKRGRCCDNNCRHCPYKADKEQLGGTTSPIPQGVIAPSGK
jgi:hypothetical protein